MNYSLPGSSVHGILQARILVPLSVEFSKQEYWLPFPSPGNLPDPRIKLVSPALAGWFFTTNHQGSPNTTPYTGLLFPESVSLAFPLQEGIYY